jgi:hypothetical protein
MNDPPKRKNRPLSEPATTARPTHSGRNAGLGPLRSGYALPASPQPRVLFLIDAGFSSCLSRCKIVEYLFNAWEDGVESVSTEVMFADLEFKSSSRMRDIFKDHEDWRDLIEATGGACRLRIRELLQEQRARAD